MKKREIFMVSALAFSIGTVFGFLISPVKNGFGNNCGNSINNYYGKDQSKADEAVVNGDDE